MEHRRNDIAMVTSMLEDLGIPGLAFRKVTQISGERGRK